MSFRMLTALVNFQTRGLGHTFRDVDRIDRRLQQLRQRYQRMQLFGSPQGQNRALYDLQQFEAFAGRARGNAAKFGAYAVIWRTIGKFIAFAVQEGAKLEMLRTQFTAFFSGNQVMADDLIAKIRKMAAATPLLEEDLFDTSRMLVGFGFSADETAESLQRLGAVAVAVGKPLHDVARIYGESRTQGRLFARDVRQFTTRGIPLIDALAKTMGVAEHEIDGLVTRGKVGFKELEEAFKYMTEEGGRYHGLLQKAAETTIGQTRRLYDNWKIYMGAIGESLLKFYHVSDILGAINRELTSINMLIGALPRTDLADQWGPVPGHVDHAGIAIKRAAEETKRLEDIVVSLSDEFKDFLITARETDHLKFVNFQKLLNTMYALGQLNPLELDALWMNFVNKETGLEDEIKKANRELLIAKNNLSEIDAKIEEIRDKHPDGFVDEKRLQVLRSMLEMLAGAKKANEDLKKAQEEAARAAERQEQELQRRADTIRDSVMTPAEEAKKAFEELESVKDRISEQEYARRLHQIRAELGEELATKRKGVNEVGVSGVQAAIQQQLTNTSTEQQLQLANKKLGEMGVPIQAMLDLMEGKGIKIDGDFKAKAG
jgi:tape measure domain-containing protein